MSLPLAPAEGHVAVPLTVVSRPGADTARSPRERATRDFADDLGADLINRAAGRVGTYAMLIAAAFGAEVTGVCSTGNVELVRSISAAHVIDYPTGAFTDGRALHDRILDNACSRPLRRVVTRAGTLVLNGGGSPGRVVGAVVSILRAVVVNAVVRERLRLVRHEQKRENLLTLTGLIKAGTHTGPRPDVPAGRHSRGPASRGAGALRGKVVITGA